MCYIDLARVLTGLLFFRFLVNQLGASLTCCLVQHPSVPAKCALPQPAADRSQHRPGSDAQQLLSSSDKTFVASVSNLEVKLIKKGKLKLKHLAALRLVFLELANLTSARSVLQKVLVAGKRKLKARHCTRQQIELEARSLLQCRGGRGAHHAPVILLVDEVSKLATL